MGAATAVVCAAGALVEAAAWRVSWVAKWAVARAVPGASVDVAGALGAVEKGAAPWAAR